MLNFYFLRNNKIKLLSGFVNLLLVILFAILPCSLFAGTNIQDTNNKDLEIKSKYLGRLFSIKDGHLKTVKITNYQTGENYRVSSGEFLLKFGNGAEITSEDCKLVNHYDKVMSDGIKRLVFELESKERQLTITLTFETAMEWNYIRKYFKIKSKENSNFDLIFLDTERMKIEKINNPGDQKKFMLWDGYPENINPFEEKDMSSQSQVFDGQPVYTADLFWGIEYPSAINTVDKNGNILLRYYVNRNLKSYKSQFTVMGGSDQKGVRKAFYEYIEEIRVKQAEPFIVYNSWYHQRRLDHINTIEIFDELNEKLLKPYNITLDAFALDDYWDNFSSLWEIDPVLFPDGFENLVSHLRKFGSSLGLWASPFGGYGYRCLARVKWGDDNGYETIGDDKPVKFCIAARDAIPVG